MRHKRLLGSLAIMAGLGLSAASAQADSITFTDTMKNFPDYTISGFGDEYGTPHIDRMVVTWDDATGFLSTVDVVFRSTGGRRDYDTLFINTDYGTADSDWHGWDYLVRYDKPSYDANGSLASGLYTVADDYSYTLVTSGGRNGHPNGILDTDLTMADSSFRPTYSSYTLSYNFSGLSIDLGDSFSIAYAPFCANDVIGGSNVGSEVPEPATMLLFGTGLAGLGAIRRRMRKS